MKKMKKKKEGEGEWRELKKMKKKKKKKEEEEERGEGGWREMEKASPACSGACWERLPPSRASPDRAPNQVFCSDVPSRGRGVEWHSSRVDRAVQ
jgi:hypothetical protein